MSSAPIQCGQNILDLLCVAFPQRSWKIQATLGTIGYLLVGTSFCLSIEPDACSVHTLFTNDGCQSSLGQPSQFFHRFCWKRSMAWVDWERSMVTASLEPTSFIRLAYSLKLLKPTLLSSGDGSRVGIRITVALSHGGGGGINSDGTIRIGSADSTTPRESSHHLMPSIPTVHPSQLVL